jgi:hypothetical protein
VFAADAWHWIEPALGFSKAMQLLCPAGTIAIASHRVVGFRPDDFGDRVRGRMPRPGTSKPEQATWGPDPELWGAAIDACGFFDAPQRSVYRFERVLDADSFVAVQATYGSNLDLTSAARAALDVAVRQVINDELNGRVIKVEEAVLFTARRS